MQVGLWRDFTSFHSPAGGCCHAWGPEVWGQGLPLGARWTWGKTPPGIIPSLTTQPGLQMTLMAPILPQCPLLTLHSSTGPHGVRRVRKVKSPPYTRPSACMGWWIAPPDGCLHLSRTVLLLLHPGHPRGASSASPGINPATRTAAPQPGHSECRQSAARSHGAVAGLSRLEAAARRPSPWLIGLLWEMRPVGSGASRPESPLTRGVNWSKPLDLSFFLCKMGLLPTSWAWQKSSVIWDGCHAEISPGRWGVPRRACLKSVHLSLSHPDS